MSSSAVELDHIETLDDLSNAIRAAQDQIDGLSGEKSTRRGLSRHSSVRTGLSLGDISDAVEEMELHPLQNVKDLLQSLQSLCETLFEIRQFLQYSTALEKLVTQLSDIDPEHVLHVRTLVELMNATAIHHKRHQCIELRFVTLLEIAISYNENWKPSENLNSIWSSQLELMVEDDSTAEDFRRNAYKILISLAWVPSSYGLADACGMTEPRFNNLPKAVTSRLAHASLSKSEPIFRTLTQIENSSVFTIVVTHSYDYNSNGSGIGKTSLAALLVAKQQLAAKYRIVWVDAPRNIVGLNCREYMKCIDSILKQIGEAPNWPPLIFRLEDVSLRKMREKEHMIRAKRGMSKLLKKSQKTPLLIIDGADHENDVEKFRFLETQSTVAITKSSFIPRVTFTIEVEPLGMDEATHLFAEEAALQSSNHIMMHTVEVKTILRQCQFHPLVIRTVARWFQLKRITAGFSKALEELSLELSVLKHSKDTQSEPSKVLAQVLKIVLCPSRRSGGQPTRLLKLCLASVGVVFGDRSVPLEAYHALWSNLLRTHPDAVGELGFDVRPTDLFKRVWFISECFIHLGILETAINEEEDQVFVKIFHPMYLDYAKSLITELSSQDETDAKWHGCFVAGYHAMRKIVASTKSLQDRCRVYALERLVHHMIESRNIPKVVEILKEDAFFKERIQCFGFLKGTQIHVDDCLMLQEKAKDSKSATAAETRKVILAILKKASSILGKAAPNLEKAKQIERAKAIHLVGFTQADNLSFSEALSQYKIALTVISSIDQSHPYAAIFMHSQAVLHLIRNEHEKAHKKIKGCMKILGEAPSLDSGIGALLRPELIQLKGDALVAACDYLGAEQCYKEALDPSNNKESRIDMGSALYRKGKLHQMMGELDKGLATLIECIGWKNSIGETDTVDLARANSTVGDIYLELQHDRKAVTHFEAALQILGQKDDDKDADVDCKIIRGKLCFLKDDDVTSNKEFSGAMKLIIEAPRYLMDRSAYDIRSMARVCMDRGEKSVAVEMLEVALSLTTERLESLERATILFDLGHCLYESGDKKEALVCFEDSLKIRRAKLGECELVLETLGTMANCIKSLSLHDVRLDVRRQVYELTKKLYHGNDEKSAIALFAVGEAEEALGLYDEAVATWNECISLLKRALCGDHPYLAEIFASLAKLHSAQGDFDVAHTWYLECLKNRQANLDPDNPILAETLFGIGVLARKRGEYHSARDFLAEALKIQKEHQLTNETCLTLIELGNAYRLLRDPSSASGCYERCLTIIGQSGNMMDLVGKVKLLKGHAHLNENNLALATECYEEALRIRAEILGRDHISTAQASRSLGFAKHLAKSYSEARTYLGDYIRAMDLLKHTATVDYVMASHLLGEVHMAEGRHEEATRMFSVAHAILEKNVELCEKLPTLNETIDLRLKRASVAPKEKGFFSRITELTRLDDEVAVDMTVDKEVETLFRTYLFFDDM